MTPEYSEQSLWFSENLLPHEAMLRGWLRSRFPAGLDMDDVIQESYLRILRHHKEKPIKAPKAFLFATARNIALNMERAANVRGERLAQIQDLEILDDGWSVQETVARNQELEALTEAIQALPNKCRQIFTLCKVYGMTPKEISGELNLSLPTIYRQLSIGVDKCGDFMQNLGHRELS
ncbi:MAG: sigma-70 family RNA polymerase sigma factor [Opitutae bacterium]|nr:sigma-70 family RNA polymerase sigma factor [Opitutae bacterium]MBC9890544.1 sigma-70 family RNA polymerase sigma factor [Opitutae bacterium]